MMRVLLMLGLGIAVVGGAHWTARQLPRQLAPESTPARSRTVTLPPTAASPSQAPSVATPSSAPAPPAPARIERPTPRPEAAPDPPAPAATPAVEREAPRHVPGETAFADADAEPAASEDDSGAGGNARTEEPAEPETVIAGGGAGGGLAPEPPVDPEVSASLIRRMLALYRHTVQPR